MSSWGNVFRFLVAFGGGCALFAGVLVVFLGCVSKFEKWEQMDRKDRR